MNATVANDQKVPSVAMDVDGDFVVVWEGVSAANGKEIYARRYQADGTPEVQGEFVVNTNSNGDEKNPFVAMDDAGNFVVAWETPDPVVGTNIDFQRFDNTGTKVGAEIQVNTTDGLKHKEAKVAMDPNGGFVFIWEAVDAGLDAGIFAELYDNTGTLVKAQFTVNTTTADKQQDASVSMDDSGNFVVTWTSSNQDGGGDGVYAQRFNSLGVADVQGEFLVNTTTTAGNQQQSSVAMVGNGEFVVAWQSAEDRKSVV